MTRPLTLPACPLDIPSAPREVTRASAAVAPFRSERHLAWLDRNATYTYPGYDEISPTGDLA